MVISSIQTRINKKMKNKNINKIKDINIINMNYKLSDIGKSCKNKTGKISKMKMVNKTNLNFFHLLKQIISRKLIII